MCELCQGLVSIAGVKTTFTFTYRTRASDTVMLPCNAMLCLVAEMRESLVVVGHDGGQNVMSSEQDRVSSAK